MRAKLGDGALDPPKKENIDKLRLEKSHPRCHMPDLQLEEYTSIDIFRYIAIGRGIIAVGRVNRYIAVGRETDILTDILQFEQ